ncbi:osmotically inducible protein OsmC [Chitinophagaceae bacterium IBVUCB1]|nr:osmotically inducible protein OsmC [Chitinophagaceae bacterium IBVUCB1]
MSEAHYYEVAVKWQADRLGVMSSPDFGNTLEVVTPPQFAKGIPDKWSPEHLLVAAVNSCLMTTFLAIAENSKLAYEHFESTGVGKLEIVDGKYMISEVALKPVIIINNHEDKEKAMRIIQKSEAACLISNSIKSKIIFTPEIKLAATV